MTRFARPALVVVKVGSSSLRAADGQLDRDRLAALADDVAAVRAAGTRVVLVSSGAVSAGIGQLGLDRRPMDLPTLQAAAAVGQGELVHAWSTELGRHGLSCGQILLNQDDVVHRHRFLTGRTTLHRLLELGAVPVINENDAVATEELVYGDNDHLAAVVATMLGAKLLLLLSDVAGLLSGDPATDPSATLVDRVDDPASLDLSRVGGSSSGVGSGGMTTKVEASSVAVRAGCHAVIADARTVGVVEQVVAGDELGTWFVAQARTLEARRLWIGSALRPHGVLTIDDGAVRALRERASSLLAVGVVAVEGEFDAGDLVELRDTTGLAVARGLVRLRATDVARALGRSSASLAAELGAPTGELVNRDDLVLLHHTR
jgi:glutamate 5-kinase